MLKKVFEITNFIWHFIAATLIVRIITEQIDKSDYGVYTYVLMFLVLSVQVSGNFFFPGMIREWQKIKSTRKPLIILLKCITIVMVLNALISTLIYVLFLNEFNKTFVFLTFLLASFKGLTRMMNQLLNMDNKRNMYVYLESIILLFTVIILTFNDVKSILIIVIILNGIFLVQLALQLSLLITNSKSPTLRMNEHQLLDKIYRYSRSFVVTNIVVYVVQQFDRYYLNKFMSIEVVGIYSANFQLSWAPFVVSTSILAAYLMPKINKHFDSKDSLKIDIDRRLLSFAVGLVILSYISGPLLIKYMIPKMFNLQVCLVLITAGWLSILTSLGELIFGAARRTTDLNRLRIIVFVIGILLTYMYYVTLGTRSVIGVPLVITYIIYLIALLKQSRKLTLII